MFRLITRPEVFLERIWTESSFGSRARGTPWGIANRCGGRRGWSRTTADGSNHELRRYRDDSAGVQLEEVFCAGREVLHCYLISQARWHVPMCLMVGLLGFCLAVLVKMSR
jgi:hypothetical protein